MHNCPLCQSDKLTVIQEEFRNKTKRDAYSCAECKLVFSSKIFEITQEELDGFYEEDYLEQYYDEAKSNIVRNFDNALPYQRVRLQRLTHILPDITSMLEIGCGPGYFLHETKPHATRLVGIEKNTSEREFVNKELGIPCYNSIAELGEEQFDCLVMNQVLEHTLDPLQFIKEHIAFLKSGGYLIIEVPSMTNALVSLYHCAPFRNFWFQEPHLYYYSPDTLRTTIEQVIGTKNIEIHNYQETSYINHYNWIEHQKKSPSRSVAISDDLPTPVKDASLNKELQALYENFNCEYKDILQKRGFADYILAIAQIA